MSDLSLKMDITHKYFVNGSNFHVVVSSVYENINIKIGSFRNENNFVWGLCGRETWTAGSPEQEDRKRKSVQK